MRNFTIMGIAVLALAACSGGTEDHDAMMDDGDMPMDDGTYMGDSYQDHMDGVDRANMGAPMMGDGELGSDAMMQGEWFDKMMAGHPAALFGPPESEARFSVRCEDGELVFTRGVSVDAETIPMHLMAGGMTRTINADAQTDPLPQVSGKLPSSDSFADTLGSTEEPIAVAVEGGPSYRMPSSAIMRRVVSECGD